MVEIEIKPDGKRLVITRFVDGKPADGDKIDPTVKKQRVVAARWLGVKEEQLFDWIKQGPAKYAVQSVPVESSGFTIRGEHQKRADGETMTQDALFGPGHELDGIAATSLVDWSSFDQVCCLDVDYHESTPPAEELLKTAVYCRLSPRPFCWHFSRGGGMHLFYLAADPYTAEDLAAIAALRWRTIDPAAGVELKRCVRGPGGKRVYWSQTQDTTGGLSGWLGATQSDGEAVAEYLSARGMELGRRYDHDHCPCHPTDDPGRHRQPVTVSEAGVYCFVCEGKGRCFGSRKAGFFPWSAILDTPGSSDVAVMIRSLTHWGHAKWVLTEKYGLPEPLALVAYRAALKAHHADSPKRHLIPLAFHDHTSDVTRIDDGWRTVDGYTYPKDIQPLLGCLPVAMTTNEAGEVKTSPSAVCLLQQSVDLSRYGYQSIDVVHGFRLSSVHLPVGSSCVVARPHTDILKAGVKYLPEYQPKSKRLAEDKAWAVLESVFPGIDRNFTRYSIAAIACAQETRSGMLPLTFTSGPSGSAKTTTPRVAAAILGATAADIVHQNDETRYRASVKQGKQRSACLLFNEVLKEAQRSQGKNFTFRAAFDFFLTLTQDSYSHTLHVGPERMGRLPACFLSEPAPPPDLREETQIARRMRHLRLDGMKADWGEKWAAVGLTGDALHRLRLVSPEMAAACNTILSDVVDEFFAVPMTFDTIADKLGVFTVLNNPDFEDPTPFLLDLFRLVRDAPELENEREKKLYSRGYKKINKTDDDTDLVSVYSMFADGPPGTPEWLKARKLQEKDWSGLLRVPHPVRVDIKNNGVSVYLRFAVGPIKNPRFVNGEITA